MVLIPSLLAYLFILRLDFRVAHVLIVYKKEHWALTQALYFGFALVIWIIVEIQIVGGGAMLQTIFGLHGVLISALSLLPSHKRYFILPTS
jgi:hypothetical protein